MVGTKAWSRKHIKKQLRNKHIKSIMRGINTFGQYKMVPEVKK